MLRHDRNTITTWITYMNYITNMEQNRFTIQEQLNIRNSILLDSTIQKFPEINDGNTKFELLDGLWDLFHNHHIQLQSVSNCRIFPHKIFTFTFEDFELSHNMSLESNEDRIYLRNRENSRAEVTHKTLSKILEMIPNKGLTLHIQDISINCFQITYSLTDIF